MNSEEVKRKSEDAIKHFGEFSIDLADVFGRSKFQSFDIATLFRQYGFNIPEHREVEQAFFAWWKAGLFLTYGNQWKRVAAEIIEAIAIEVDSKDKPRPVKSNFCPEWLGLPKTEQASKEKFSCWQCSDLCEPRTDNPKICVCSECLKDASFLPDNWCPGCGWDSSNFDGENPPMKILDQKPDYEYGHCGGSHWIEEWVCPMCGEVFKFSNSSV